MVKILKKNNHYAVIKYYKHSKPVTMFSGTKENCTIYRDWLKRKGKDLEGKPVPYESLIK